MRAVTGDETQTPKKERPEEKYAIVALTELLI